MAKKNGRKKIVKKYKAIIFDLDGTLINSLPYHSLAFKDLLLEHGIRVDEEYLRKYMGLSTRLILGKLKIKYKFRENIDDLREERRYHYFKFLGRKNIVFPGVMATLEKLRLKYKIAIATGSSRVTFTHSTDRDFQELFDCIITINDVPRGKPHPDQLLLAARKMKVKPNECVEIGDAIYDGIASKRAGIDFIGVTTGTTTEKQLKKAGAKRIISNIRELKLL